MKRILVIGAAGQIGSELTVKLEKYTVIIMLSHLILEPKFLMS